MWDSELTSFKNVFKLYDVLPQTHVLSSLSSHHQVHNSDKLKINYKGKTLQIMNLKIIHLSIHGMKYFYK